MREMNIKLLNRASRRIASAMYSPLKRDELVKSIAEEFGLEVMEVLLLVDALEDLKRNFPNKSTSWYVRAVLRVFSGIERVAKNHWIVKGLRELGDQYPYYNVVLTRGGKYMCDCHVHAYGYIRRVKVCTHVAAVMISKRVGVQLRIL
ncbi:MAG: hypothetical protein DRJ49_02660 [Thermoprotei archaeon]|mgnify:CR=1 FL=1|nr:MAG: hypothetical protein DRN53_03155 [Thermoprotei archaeon]RLE89537.1 MAG: hypothetical protein DRJ49_02660 [Thermoprotei archaeon]